MVDREFTIAVSDAGAVTGTEITPPPAPPIPAGYTVVAADASKLVGVADPTAYIQSMLDGLQSGQALKLPNAPFNTSNILVLANKKNVMVFGGGKDVSIINALNPLQSAFVVHQGDTVNCSDFQVYSPNATARLDDGKARAFSANLSKNITFQRLKGRKVNNAVCFYVTTDSRILDSEAVDTTADSFHITGSAARILVQGNLSTRAGDDAFSSIGYAGSPNTDISFIGNTALDGTSGGGGIGIEGTSNSRVLNNRIYRSRSAGIRVQSWDSYPTDPCNNVDIAFNYLEACVQRPELLWAHGAVTLVTDVNYLHGINVYDNEIHDPVNVAILAQGASAAIDVTGSAMNNRMTGKVPVPFVIRPFANLPRTGNTLNGVPVN